VPLSAEGAGSSLNTMSPGPRPISEPYGNLISPVVSSFDAIDMGPKLMGGVVPLFGNNGHRPKMGSCAHFGAAKLGPNLKQCGLRRGLRPCQISSWSIQSFGQPIRQCYRQTGQDRQQSDSKGERFYKRLLKNGSPHPIGAFLANVNSRSRSLYAVARPSVVCLSVCRLSSVTLVHPTQAVQLLGNISTAFGTLAIH